MTRHRFMLICILLAAISVLPATATMLMTPYLQAVSQRNVFVLVECDTPLPVTVEYGTKTRYGKTAFTRQALPTDATPPTYVHRVELTGLKPNTRYHYRAKQDGEWTVDVVFSTAVKPGIPFRFAWLADTRTQTAIHAKIAAAIKAASPRFSLYGGDLCGDGSYASFKKEFFLPEQLALAAEVPFFNATGNHEGWRTNTMAFTQAPASPSGVQEYYSFDYGNVHFLALNTQLPVDAQSAQYRYAMADLASTRQPWKIVYLHSHPYCAGGHGEVAELKTMAEKVFVPNGVALVFSGHSHFFEHSLVEGIHYFIIGSAGAPLYDPGTAPYLVKSAKDYNYALIDVTHESLTVTVKNAEGKLLDSLALPAPKKK